MDTMESGLGESTIRPEMECVDQGSYGRGNNGGWDLENGRAEHIFCAWRGQAKDTCSVGHEDVAENVKCTIPESSLIHSLKLHCTLPSSERVLRRWTGALSFVDRRYGARHLPSHHDFVTSDLEQRLHYP